MYLLNLAQFWALALCLQVFQHLSSDLEMFLCVSGIYKKYMVYGALIIAEILTFLLPMYFLNMAWIMGTSTQLMGVSTPPK